MAQKHGFSGKIQTRHPDPSASSELVLSLECQNPIEFPGNIKMVCVFACSTRFMYACVYIYIIIYIYTSIWCVFLDISSVSYCLCICQQTRNLSPLLAAMRAGTWPLRIWTRQTGMSFWSWQLSGLGKTGSILWMIMDNHGWSGYQKKLFANFDGLDTKREWKWGIVLPPHMIHSGVIDVAGEDGAYRAYTIWSVWFKV